MVSPESSPANTTTPRISFSAEFLDDADFISINPHDKEKVEKISKHSEFEFLSNNNSSDSPLKMMSADELFFEGKLLPFWQKQCSEKLTKISLKPEKVDEVSKGEDLKKIEDNNINNNGNRMSWFIDEDPSPRPPKCTVLWKELLRLKKQRASSLSPSSSTSSSSSSKSSLDEDSNKKDKTQVVKRIKKGLERTRSTGLKIRPMVNLPVCTQGVRSSSLPPLYSIRKGMLDR